MEIASVQNPLVSIAATSDVQPPERKAENRELIQAVKALNGTGMFGQDRELTFQMDRQTRHMVIRIVDRKTKETISQVPPEYVLRLAGDLNQGSK